MNTESTVPAFSYATTRKLKDWHICLIAGAAGVAYAVIALMLICYA